VQTPLNAQDIAITNQKVEFRDQSYYLNFQLLALEEKLALNYGQRADRSSANGDREKFYNFPKYSASYRFVKPFTNKIDEIKFRAAKGQSGNRPRYADRDVLYANGGLIGGNASLVSNGLLGNTQVKPETMNELEYGTDMTFFGSRLGLEFSRYERKITDLLLTFPLPPSSGSGQPDHQRWPAVRSGQRIRRVGGANPPRQLRLGRQGDLQRERPARRQHPGSGVRGARLVRRHVRS
jgi:hypothetical protein